VKAVLKYYITTSGAQCVMMDSLMKRRKLSATISDLGTLSLHFTLHFIYYFLFNITYYTQCVQNIFCNIFYKTRAILTEFGIPFS